MRRLLPLLLAFAAAPAVCEAPEWRGVDASTGQLSSIYDLTELSDDFPASSSVRLRLLNVLLEAGDEGVSGQAAALAMFGYAFGEAGEARVAESMEAEAADAFHEGMARNREVVERSALLEIVPADALLVEGVARDPATGWVYATTVVSRALYVKRGDRPWEKIELEGAGSLSGIVHDPAGGLLWIASGNFEQTPGTPVYSALLGFDPAQGKVVRTLYANGVVALGDVAVGEDGNVYVADPEAGVIHYARPGDDGLRAMVGPGIFRSPQGMVPVPGTSLLIVSDYRYGLAALDMRRGKVWRIAAEDPVFLDGIDALQRHGNSLIAVQNGHSPMRILKLDMSPDWLRVERATVLESNHPGWTEPVGGTIDGDELLYVGTGQWERFGKGGVVTEGDQPGPTELRSLPVDER